MNAEGRSSGGNRATPAVRLESWKEIAVYLKRGVRTVRRWEKEEGLPVHRQWHKKLGSVYAHPSELDAWRDSRRARAPVPLVHGRDRGPRTSARVVVAVLPFEDLSGTVEQTYIADGLTDEMIGQLGRFNPDTLGVIARTTMMHYRGLPRPVRQIGDELQVDYVMEGSVRCEGDRVRVVVRLIDVADQAHVWARSFDQSMSNILSLQRDLAADIAREVHVRLSPSRPGDESAAKRVNPEAYHAHLKGRHFLTRFNPESVRRSVDYFTQAIAADPTYAPAYASLAEACGLLPMWTGAPSAPTHRRALEAAERALALDPNLAGAYASLGLINANYLWEWAAAERYFRRALELDPNCPPARQWYAEFLGEMGRVDDALAVLEWARTHDPLSRSVGATRTFVLWLGRRFDEAIAEAERVLEIDPDYPMALIRLGMARAGKGQYREAVRALQAAEVAAPELVDCMSLQGYAHGMAGSRAEALVRLDRLRRLARRRHVPAFLFANVYLGLGEPDKAVRFMEQEYEARGWYLVLIKHASQFAVLRDHPRYQALLRRMSFPA